MKNTQTEIDANCDAKIVRLRIADLVAHALQAQFVDACSPEEDEQLREDLRSGQRTSTKVLPANAGSNSFPSFLGV